MVPHERLPVATLEPPDGEMRLRDTLKVINENEVDGRSPDGAEDRFALAANRSEAITPKRDATSVTRLFTTGVDALTVLRSMR